MKRKLLIVLLAVISALCIALCFTACGGNGGNLFGNSDNIQTPGGNTGDTGDTNIPEDDTGHTHDWGEWQVTTPATCMTQGEEMRVCSCGEKERRPVSALGHDVDKSDKVTEYATCQADGSVYTVCKRCGEKFVETILQKNPNNHYIDEDKDTTDCSGCGINLATWMTLEISSNGKEATLTHAEGKAVIVPAVYHGSPVTSIGKGAFSWSTSLESVTIPDGVTSIGKDAFSWCTSLTSITIPNGVTSIGDQVFYDCRSLESITIPDSVTSIGYRAFDGCTALTSITIPDGVTSIGDQVFYNCTALESITIPDSVTSIGEQAFVDCTALERVNITSIKSWCNIDFYGSHSNPLDYAHNLYLDGELVKNLEVPEDVTSIGKYAFYDCESLESITIPYGVTSIGESAFDNCQSLTSINIPDSVTSIGRYAFGGCTNLETATIPALAILVFSPLRQLKHLRSVAITSGDIVGDAFSGCISLTSVTIGDGVTSIGERAFYDCRSLERVNITSIKSWCNIDFGGYGNPLCYAHNLYLNGELVKNLEIPEDVTSIGSTAFVDCTSLESITIPDGVTEISDWAFERCTSLESVIIPNSVTSIGEGAFYDCRSLESITIGNGVTSIGDLAFERCTLLTSVTIGNSVTSIGKDAFVDCTALESVYITSIKSWCNIDFYGSLSNPLDYAHNLYLDGELVKNLEIPEDVTSIGKYAFYNCTSLTSITIPNGVTSIGDQVFYNCTALESIEVDEENKNYASQDGILYNKEKTEFIHIPDAIKGAVTIPYGVTSIGYRAFDGCTALESITIPDSVTSIDYRAFDGCTALESITIPDSVTSIDDSSFKDCTALESVNITSIKSWCNIDFYGSLSNPLRYAHNLYLDGELVKNLEIPEDVTSIGKYAFYGCTLLESVTIPDSVTSIGKYAFYGCTLLESVIIGNGVTSIGNRAFYGCKNLTSVKFENTTSWKVSKSSDMSNATNVTVTNPTKNAELLTDTYFYYYYWKRG